MSGYNLRARTMRRIAIPIWVSFIALLLAGWSVGLASSGRSAALFGGGTPTRTVTPTATRTAPRTATATRTPITGALNNQLAAGGLATQTRQVGTPTRTPITGSLKKQLAWGGLGAGEDILPCDKTMLKNQRTPALVDLGRRKEFPHNPGSLVNHGMLCVFGIPFQDGFTVDLYKPNGELADHVTYLPASSFEDLGLTIWTMQPTGRARDYPEQYAADLGGLQVIALDLWEPAGLPEGRWRMSLSAPSAGFTSDFNILPYPQVPLVRLNKPPVWAFPKASPLESPKEKVTYNESLDPLKTGEGIRLYGANFTAGSIPLIGLYLFPLQPDATGRYPADLVEQINTKADRSGAWQINYIIPPSDPPGEYVLVVVLDPQTVYGNSIGPQISYRVESWQPCPGGYTSVLRKGMRAQVIEGQKPNRVRAQPSLGSKIKSNIPAGQPFDLLDGPSCADNWVWWNVRTQGGNVGWTAEGDQSEQWLEAVE